MLQNNCFLYNWPISSLQNFIPFSQQPSKTQPYFMVEILVFLSSNSYSTLKVPKKQTTKLHLQNLKKISHSCFTNIGNSKICDANSTDPDVAQFEPPHLDLCCL